MNNNPEAKVTVKMINDEFKRGAKELTDESKLLSKEFKLQSEQMKLTASETEKLEARLEFLKNKQDLAKQSVENAQSSYDKAVELFGENSKAADDLAKKLLDAQIEEQKLANDISTVNTQLDEHSKKTETSADKIKELGERVEGTGTKMKDAGDAMTDVGARMTAGVTAPILGAAAAARSAWEEVDEGLDTIVSKTGASGDALASLEGSFTNVAKTTKFDMATIGEAIGEVNTQFGLTGPALDDASTKMLKFADINGANVTDSSIKAKQAMSLFNLEADQLDYVLDSVTKTAQNTGQSTDALFDSVVKGAPQMQALGLDFAQSVEVLGNFEKAGIDSTTAMSYMTRAQVQFAKEGVTLQDGLETTIDKITNASSETEALALAAEVFGTKGAPRMVDAIKSGAMSFDDFSNASANAAGSVESTFDGMADPIDNVSIMMNNLKLAGADLFGQLQEMLLPVAIQLIGWLQQAVEWFSGLSSGMKQTIIIVLAIVAAIGPLVMWIGTLVSTLGGMVLVVGKAIPFLAKLGPIFTGIRTALALLTGPIGIAIAIITLLGVVIYKNWDTIKAKTIQIFSAISVFFTAVWASMKAGFINFVSSAVAKFGEFRAKAQAIFSAAGSIMSNLTSSAKAAVVSIITNLVSDGVSRFNNMKSRIQSIFESIRSTASSIFSRVKSAITNPIETAKTTVLGIIDRIKNAFTNMKITIPKPKIPKVSVSMGTKKFMGADVPVPKFDITWFKTGGVFNKKAILGNAGFGDVAEAIVPFQGSHADRIAELIAVAQNRLANARTPEVIVLEGNVSIDDHVLGKVMFKKIEENMQINDDIIDLMGGGRA